MDLFEKDPGGKVNSGELFGKGKHIIFAVPGAFTPGCSKVCEYKITKYKAEPAVIFSNCLTILVNFSLIKFSFDYKYFSH